MATTLELFVKLMFITLMLMSFKGWLLTVSSSSLYTALKPVLQDEGIHRLRPTNPLIDHSSIKNFKIQSTCIFSSNGYLTHKCYFSKPPIHHASNQLKVFRFYSWRLFPPDLISYGPQPLHCLA